MTRTPSFPTFEKPMHKFHLVCILLLVVISGFGCHAGDSSQSPSTPSISDKAITVFGFSSPAALGTIDESAKTISVLVPNGTPVTTLVASFVTTGAIVTVGSTTQVSGTIQNDFTNPVAYTVTANDSSTATYTVTVTIRPAAPTLIWDAVTTNSDGNPATISGYKIYYGTSAGFYTAVKDVSTATTYAVSNLGLPSDTYYFAITAYDSLGNESDFSNEVSYSF